MGTNVVRLTDRKYMRELRKRIDEDYRMQLANRIKNREVSKNVSTTINDLYPHMCVILSILTESFKKA